MFTTLVDQCYQQLPGFGKRLGADGKAIESFALRKGNHPNDCRGEHDAEWGTHEHFHQNERGEMVKTIKSWFGFTLHLVAETVHKLPITYTVTPASKNEQPVARELLDRLNSQNPEIGRRAEYFSADRGYDSTETIIKLWDTYHIKPVIGIRNQWKDGEQSKVVPGTENAVYTYDREVRCVCPKTGSERDMAYRGFEEKRGTLNYQCPAAHYGYACAGMDQCPLYQKALRIPLDVDRRVFTPVARSSYAWKREYHKRTALERINSRLDRTYGFELHTHRGLHKMEMMVGIAFIVMHAMAIGRYTEHQAECLHSLVQQVS